MSVELDDLTRAELCGVIHHLAREYGETVSGEVGMGTSEEAAEYAETYIEEAIKAVHDEH